MERRSAASGPCVLARQKGVGDEPGQKPRYLVLLEFPTGLVLAWAAGGGDSERLLR